MLYTEKGTVEDFIIRELQKLGWLYIEPQKMNSMRGGNFKEPLVTEKLTNALRRINRGVELTGADLDFIITTLQSIPQNIEGIERILDIFRNGLVVTLRKEEKEEVIRLIDFDELENNEFIVTNQFKVEGLRPGRPDIVLLINGIPVALIEAKNPTREGVDWTDAYNQIKRYEKEIPEIFKYVQFSIATDGVKAYYFPNAFRDEAEERNFLGIWRDPYPFKREELGDDALKITVYGLLSKRNLMDIIENFIFFRKEMDRKTKIMARYMQFRATNKIFQRVIQGLRGKEEEKLGLIWHWQGSGKTYTMAFSAWKLFHSPEAEGPSIFVVVDRKDLEEQIEKDFAFIGVPIEKVGSVRELIEVLRWGKEGKRGIFLVTIEKFRPKEFAQLEKEGERIEIKRGNVVVLADEVHRTHYGKFATMMRSVFRNAFIFGFTGTPLSKAERSTFEKFCPKGELYLDRYSMLDAIEDGFTVPLSYQARLPNYHLERKKLEELLRFEEEEIEALSPEERGELRKRIRAIKAILKKPERVDAIAEDIASHFREMVEPAGLKALIVTVDREACVLYKRAIDQRLPPKYSEVVMTFGSRDGSLIKRYREELEERYKTRDIGQIYKMVVEDFKRRGEPKILIVTDMLITGFDSPNLWVMYLDKPLREHRLLQAMARTNRPLSNKKFGLIVDYVGVLAELENALQKFETSDAKMLRIVIRDLEREKEEFEELLQKTLKIFEKVKREDTRESLEAAMEVLVDVEVASNFEELLRELMRLYEMLKGDPFLRPYLTDYKWLTKIWVYYNKKFKKIGVDELKIEELSRKTVQLIQQTIDVRELEETFPTVAIDEEYLRMLRNSPPKTVGAAIDVISNILQEVRTHPTSPFFMSLSKEVEETYERLRARKIETEEAAKRLISISERIAQWKKEEGEIGRDRYPVYEVLKATIPEIGKERAIAVTNDIIDHLRKQGLLFEGWNHQYEVRQKVKAEIRFLLLKELKSYKSRLDQLTESIFEALKGIK